MQDKLNGVDRDSLMATVNAVKADPAVGAFTFRLRNDWIGGGHNRSVIDDYVAGGSELHHARRFEVDNDEPPILLSEDRAPNPVEYVLHALAGCLTTTIVYHAAARGMKIASVKTRFEGDIDLRGFLGLSKEIRNGYREIRIVFDIEGDLTASQKAELMAMGQAYSPVFDIITNRVPVNCRLTDSDIANLAYAAE
jgi:uncharacterized OsmC-like protein